jgi:hypothetical protein
LATFVANVEPQNAPTRSGPAPGDRDGPFAAALTGGLTLFAVAIHGYHPYAEDGGLYAAGIKRLLDPGLYPHATAFVLEPMRFSLFAPAVVALTRAIPLGRANALHTALPIVLLLLHLASIAATLFAAWMLASRCWPTREARTGAVALLACWLGLPVAGTALLLMDPYLTARSLATPCMVLALAAALDMTSIDAAKASRRRALCLCLASLALAAVMHPLMAAYAAAATLLLIAARSPRRHVRVWDTAAFVISALVLAALAEHFAAPESADYLRIAATRPYWFPAQWRWYELAGLAAPLAIVAGIAWGPLRRVTPRQRATPQPTTPRRTTPQDPQCALARMSFAAGLTALAVACLFAHTAALTDRIARLQPLREFQVVYLVMSLLLGAKLGELLLRRSLWHWCAAMALLGGVMFAASRATFPNSPHVEMEMKMGLQMEQSAIANHNPWLLAFLWIRQNTPKDALFALDADYINAPGEDAQCFRAIAERSALPDYSKDGGEASIAPQLTAAWTIAQAAQQDLSAPTTDDRQRTARLTPLGVTWLVLQHTTTTRLDCPYRNAAVEVCRLH